ncbi:hypothetical protein HY345_03140 [Candidatus Microgenomates bacterium]|nr:hypothetical protein [Candidatus Microgenomates bacterium]
MFVNFISKTKARVGTTVGALLSTLGVGGSATSTICQTTCTLSGGAAPLLGTSLLAFAPLAFLVRQQIIVWWVALGFLLIFSIVYLTRKKRSKIDLVLILINSGLLGYGLPYFK